MCFTLYILIFLKNILALKPKNKPIDIRIKKKLPAVTDIKKGASVGLPTTETYQLYCQSTAF